MGGNGTESRKSRGVLLKAGPVILAERKTSVRQAESRGLEKELCLNETKW